MAEGDDDDESKTEEPSQRKLDEALKRGQIVNSREVTNFAMLLALLFSISWFLPKMVHNSIFTLQHFIEHAGQIPADEGNLGRLLVKLLGEVFIIIYPVFIATIVAAVAAAIAQNPSLNVSAESIAPKWSKVSPMSGLGRMFSTRSLVEFIKGILKMCIVGIVAFLAVRPGLLKLKLMHEYSMASMSAFMSHLAVRLMIGVCIIMGLLAILDYFYQRFEYYKSLRMTRQEIKDEYKETEGSPEVKGKLRQLRMERSRKRMMAAVPKADVVITNPTHFAVALAYDNAMMGAPRLVAKGQDAIALTIRKVAEANDVPVVENPPLARSLYATVDIDAEIPVEQYKAVAEVISYVYKLKGRTAAGG